METGSEQQRAWRFSNMEDVLVQLQLSIYLSMKAKFCIRGNMIGFWKWIELFQSRQEAMIRDESELA